MGKLKDVVEDSPLNKLTNFGVVKQIGKKTGLDVLFPLALTKKDKRGDIQPPEAEPIPRMPAPDDEAVKEAKKRSIIEQRRRSGRMSTIFTSGEGLGG